MTIETSYLLLSVFIAAAAGLVGCFALMKKMTLASDAFSHIALPGLGIAILLKINPLIGGAAALMIGGLLVWLIENRTRISSEAVIGVIFSASLAVGSLITPREDLIEALFGGLQAINPLEFVIAALISLAIIAFILKNKERLVVSLISRDLAATSGISTERLNFYFLLFFSLTIILGLRYSGVLLMGSLIIVPAAAAKYLSRSLKGMLATSTVISVVSTISGLLLASKFNLTAGPIIVIIAAAAFFAGLVLKPKD
ncbi:MAG: metal ABC transporter permease [Patescibacteria group bacterium]|nr:metal ABC transporter permease [Patescibacteria group bacterium]MCL5262010.1 metal ABC transporter permease [Patescibacteria group bacterium]